METAEGDLTILNGKGKKLTYITGSGQSVTKAYKDSTEYVFDTNYKENSFNANAKNNATKSNLITIDASQLNKSMTITGNNKNNIIIGSKGSDSLFGYSGNDTITGGKGKDTLVHESGNDVITDYKAGEDVIKIINTTLTGASVSSSDARDVIFTFQNKSTLTVKNAIKISGNKKTPQKITIADSQDKVTTRMYGEEGVTLKDSDKDTYNAASKYNVTVVKINASKRTKAIKITGNTAGNIIQGGSGKDTIIAGAVSSTINGGAGNDYIKGNSGADSIFGGKGNDLLNGLAGNDTINGGDGNDTIYGGEGNDNLSGGKGDDKFYAESGNNTITGGAGSDTIYSGTGNDVFVYTAGDGNDFIINYEVGDKIKLGKKTSVKNSEADGDDYVFTIGKSKLTIKDAADKDIVVEDSKGEQTTYNTEREYLEHWFMQNDFIEEDNLNSILSNDYNVSAISTVLNQNIKNDINLNDINELNKITFSDQKNK